MKLMNRTLLGLLGASMLLTVGCVKLWQKNLDVKTYVIEAPAHQKSKGQPLAEKLWIDAVGVLPPYNVRNLVLRKSDVEYSTSYYTELLMSPADNFRNQFYSWFSASGLFSEIAIDNRSNRSHRLAVSVMQFHGDLVESKAVLKIKVTLLDENTKENRVLFTKEYLKQQPVADPSADELIRAYGASLGMILTDVEQDMINALK